MNLIKLSVMTFIVGVLSSTAVLADPMTPSPTAELLMSNTDKAFFEKAASGGMFEIQAAKLAESTSSNPQIKSFAEQMVTDHTKAANELQTLADNKKVALPTTLAKHHQLMLDHLNGKTGADFDKAYMHEMVISHKEAISVFDNEAKHTQDADIKSFVAKTLPIIENHGGMAKALNV